MNVIHSWRNPLAAVALSLLLAAALVVSACDDDAETEPQPTNEPSPAASTYTLDDATNPGPFSVGVRTFEVTDTSRPTDPRGDFPGSPERHLPFDVWYPANDDGSDDNGRDATPDPAGGPYPLIIFAHGFTSSRVQSTTYTRHLASNGYVVAAPDFPSTNGRAPGGPNILDVSNQPEDVSFIIDTVLAYNDDPAHALHNAIDGDRIGLTGHSLGGFTTLLTVFGPNRDERIDAGVALSGNGCFFDDSHDTGTGVPIMLMTGSEDLIVEPGGNRLAYDLVSAPRYWVELIGGGHVRFADADIDDEAVVGPLDRILGREGDTEPASGDGDPCDGPPEVRGAPPISLARQQELLRTFATPFFDAYVRGDEDALRFLHDTLPALTEDAAEYEFEPSLTTDD